jgi:uncharacterized protein (DUF488 family)
MTKSIFTIGHSNRSIDHFLSLVRRNNVARLLDMRSDPGSGYATWFNRENLEPRLRREGISYVWCGDVLGGHPKPSHLQLPDGGIDFAALQRETSFQKGIEAVLTGYSDGNSALMCVEANPFACPRFFLIGRMLAPSVDVRHVDYETGEARSQRDLEEALLRDLGLDTPDFLRTDEQKLDEAYQTVIARYNKELRRTRTRGRDD